MALGVPRSASTSLWSYSFRRLKVFVSPPTGLGFISSVTHPCRLRVHSTHHAKIAHDGGPGCARLQGGLNNFAPSALGYSRGRVHLAYAMPPSCVVPRKPAGILLRRLWLTQSGSGADPSPAPLRLSGKKMARASRRKLLWASNGHAGFGMASREGERLEGAMRLAAGEICFGRTP